MEHVGELARLVVGLPLDRLPEEVRSHAKLAILDTLGTIVRGMRFPEVARWSEAASALHPGDGCALLGTGRRVSPAAACLAHGTAASRRELYAGHRDAKGLPMLQVLPAVLALAEERGSPGSEVLATAIAGYEVAVRVPLAAPLKSPPHHPSGTWGVPGAAAACARLLRLSDQETAQAIGIGLCLMTNTSLEAVRQGATVRELYAGLSGANGLLAARMAQAGMTAPADALDSVYGRLMASTVDPGQLTERLGERFEVTRNYFKMYACYRHAHPAIDAARLLRDQCGSDPTAIERIDIETYDFAAGLTNPAPANPLAAKFSLPHAVAAFLVRGEAGIEAFEPAAIADSAIAALRAKIRVKEDPALTAMQPDKRPARVRVFLEDGEIVQRMVQRPKGDPEDPWPVEALRDKFLALVRPSVGPDQAQRAWDVGQGLEHLSSLAPLLETLTPDHTQIG